MKLIVREIENTELTTLRFHDLANPPGIGSSTRSRDMTPYEGMDFELMRVARIIAGDFASARKSMKSVRSSKALAPGVYYNAGTRMVERLHSSQRPPLGNRIFRISKDPNTPVESIERKIIGGR